MTELRGSATLTVSSTFPGFPASNAVDGNTGTAWASLTDGINSWIQFTWASAVDISEIRLLARSGGNGWGFPRFTFSDSSYTDGWCIPGADTTYQLIVPKNTTSLRIGMVPNSVVGDNNSGFTEVYISDTYTTAQDTVNLHHYGVTTASSQYDTNTLSQWNPRDDNTANAWSSASEGAASWFKIDWGQNVIVETITLSNRSAGEVWGVPRFEFSDASTVDGSSPVPATGTLDYTITPKITSFLKISIASGSSGSNVGFTIVKVTGDINGSPPSVENISAAMIMSELIAGSVVNVSGATLLTELSAGSVVRASSALLLVEYVDVLPITGTTPITLNTRSTAAHLNNRATALTLEARS